MISPLLGEFLQDDASVVMKLRLSVYSAAIEILKVYFVTEVILTVDSVHCKEGCGVVKCG